MSLLSNNRISTVNIIEVSAVDSFKTTTEIWNDEIINVDGTDIIVTNVIFEDGMYEIDTSIVTSGAYPTTAYINEYRSLSEDFTSENIITGVDNINGTWTYPNISESINVGELRTNEKISNGDNILVALQDGSFVINNNITGVTYENESGLTFSDIESQLVTTGESSAERIVFCDDGKFICGSEGSAKMFTSDDGQNWIDRGVLGNGANTVFGLVYLKDGVALAGTSPAGQLFRTEDYGITWTEIIYPKHVDTTNLRGLCYGYDNTVYIANTLIAANGTDPDSSGEIFKSIDLGLTWTKVYDNTTDLGGTPGLTTARFGTYSMMFMGNNTIICNMGCGGIGTVQDSTILRSIDGGNSWYVVKDDINSYASYTCTTNESGTGLVAFSGGRYPSENDADRIYRTTDYGESWEDLGRPFRTDNNLEVDALNGLTYLSDSVWLMGTDEQAGCAVYITKDDGNNWQLLQDVSGTQNNYRCYAIAVDKINEIVVTGTFKLGGTGEILQGTYSDTGTVSFYKYIIDNINEIPEKVYTTETNITFKSNGILTPLTLQSSDYTINENNSATIVKQFGNKILVNSDNKLRTKVSHNNTNVSFNKFFATIIN